MCDPGCSLFVDDFVDDFGIFIRSKNMETIEFKLQRCLNNIEDWATENGFKFSKTKTQCVHFCQIRQLHLDPHLTIYGSPIPFVSEAKFLGLLFDNKLSFIPHIKALKAKCLKALDILKVLSSSDWGGDRTVLLNLYRSLIRSKLDYPRAGPGLRIGQTYPLRDVRAVIKRPPVTTRALEIGGCLPLLWQLGKTPNITEQPSVQPV